MFRRSIQLLLNILLIALGVQIFGGCRALRLVGRLSCLHKCIHLGHVCRVGLDGKVKLFRDLFQRALRHLHLGSAVPFGRSEGHGDKSVLKVGNDPRLLVIHHKQHRPAVAAGVVPLGAVFQVGNLVVHRVKIFLHGIIIFRKVVLIWPLVGVRLEQQLDIERSLRVKIA